MKEHKIGLNVLLFCASLLSILIGAPILGLTGIWGYLVPGNFVPHYLKVLHAHTSWWSIVILINALLIPALSLNRLFKKFFIWGSFFIIPVYVVLMVIHYNFVEPFVLNLGSLGTFYLTVFGGLAFLLEILFFTSTALISLLASGVSIPFLTKNPETNHRDEIISNVTLPAKAIKNYILFLLISAFLGIFILTQYVIQYKPISPAALVQFHTHTGFFAIGFLMTMIALKTIGAKESFVNLMVRVGVISLYGTVIGFLIFILFKTHSIVWITPSLIYFAFLVLGWLALWGRFGLREDKEEHFDFVRGSLIFLWGFLLIFVSVGPYLGLKYDTSADLTVTYYQPDGGIGGKHLGPYPDPKNYMGTAPVRGTPRGLENFHLSPGSWAHTGIFWLLILLIFGGKLTKDIGKPNLIYLLAVTIAQAPVFNAIGRFTAWVDFPNLPKFPSGPGPLYFVAHPLKVLNIILLLVITILWLKKAKQNKLQSN